MRIFRRLGIFVVITGLLISLGYFSGRIKFPKKASPSSVPISKPDPAGEKEWRKRLPQLFNDSVPPAVREGVLFALLRLQGLGPRNLRPGPGFWEVILPKGKPIHAYAYEAESLITAAGLELEEGRELEPPGERVEYRIRTGAPSSIAIRLSLGSAFRAGSVRMALVIIAVPGSDAGIAGRATNAPIPMTYALSASDTSPVAAEWAVSPTFPKEVLLELPMEPSEYPFIKPGPGALFIHHSRVEIEKLMAKRLKRFPDAGGFATGFGDRAIGNRPLMESVLGFTAAHSLLFLDLTESPRTLVPILAPRLGAVAFSARVLELQSEAKLEEEMARQCALAEKTGGGVWVVRYSRGLPDQIARLIRKHQPRFAEMGLEWVTLSSLHR